MAINKLLVITELDELSDKVSEFAVELAERLRHKEMILLNLIVPAHSQAFAASGDVFQAEGDMASRFNLTLMEKHKKLVEARAAELSTDAVEVKPYVRFNDSKTDLNEYARYFDADLILSGSRDAGTFLEKLFGSDTDKMVRKTDFPMIILKNESETSEIRDIGLAIDVDDENPNGIDEVIDFANALGVKLQLVHVITDKNKHTPDEAISKLRELAIAKRLKNYAINVVNNSNLEHGLRSFIRKYNPDMMAVLSQGKGKLHNLIYGSSTRDIIKETEKPVLICKMS
ncbi:MAG: universal stress protein [Bacteroidales bacterium]